MVDMSPYVLMSPRILVRRDAKIGCVNRQFLRLRRHHHDGWDTKKEKKVKRRTNTIRQPRETRFWKDEKQPVTAAVEKLAKSSKDALENLEIGQAPQTRRPRRLKHPSGPMTG